MKNFKHILGMSAILVMGTSFGCETKKNPEIHTRIITQMHSEERTAPERVVKIALLLDTSNSMDGLIDQAKAQLWDIVNKFAYVKCADNSRPGLKIALYEYGNDHLSPNEGYIKQVMGFSSDLDEISEKLFSLTTNGGEEYCGQVIQTSLDQLEWGKNGDDLKMVFIAGNEPFDQGKTDYRKAASHAKEKDIIVNTIFCGDYGQGIETNWKSGAEITGGEYSAIDHNRQIVHINTPYDEVIIKLNSRLNGTYISYGYMGEAKMQQQEQQDSNANSLDEVVMVKRAVSKSSRLYENANWDLVDASGKKDFKVADIQKKDLPMELRTKSDSELKEYITAKKAERTKIQEEIRELNNKREAYLVQHQSNNADGDLENALMIAIKKQALKRNYTWGSE
ncbi:MAG: vWA domain-containing protein [Sediminicola sp.]|tara:strand:- start:59529 stop:60710 length:1182 start_codon:yes stop_codon:yes gene_type:complete